MKGSHYYPAPIALYDSLSQTDVNEEKGKHGKR